MSTTIKIALIATVIIFVIAFLLVDVIPPTAMTNTRINGCFNRISIYARQNNSLPPSLANLPERKGYDNRITDGWGRPLRYEVATNGIITITSFGKDGKPGGEGTDADIIWSYNAWRPDGSLWATSEDWIAMGRIDEKKTNYLQEHAFKSPLVVTVDIDHVDMRMAGRDPSNERVTDSPIWSNPIVTNYPLNIVSIVFALPVICESEWPSLPLPVIAKDWISKRINCIPGENQKPWFMLRIAQPGSDNADWNVNVYFLPEQIQGRLCKGKFINVVHSA